ncbi:helix-turn-helix transcriptional regulator [Nocardiopsis sp. CT-R113]|uniref:Helix-turn-helix transcriptional regulator n=1 Tax=Nocardiopsis codii TaxID=3065942 RepID=A0ABU7KGH9_9ACTN|nr:helix-turn-helix transcriptional regulator [Nocardiopsis sp. CT-R113]MEE2041341.1 helix-turn-helix transcriptional regulator [Nocardiopsis sp. CT-R113]
MPQEVHRKWVPFGKEVRRRRDELGLSLPDVGLRLGVTGSMVGAIERATRIAKRQHVDKLEVLFATNGELLQFWKDTRQEGRVHEDFRSALALERKTVHIREYQSILFPGLIQTPNYARVLIEARNPQASDDEVEELVIARTARLHELIERRVTLWFVLDEAVLRRPIGSRDVLVEQLEWVEELVGRGSIRLQALPLESHPGLCAPFRLASLDKRRMVLYAEHAVGGEILESAELVTETLTLFSAMQAEALSSQATLELVQHVKEPR